MEICLFSQYGNYKPWYSSFSDSTRSDEEKKKDNPHQGIDLYARVGTPLYSCMDWEIISNERQHGEGTVVLKVTGKQVEILRSMEHKDYQNILHKEIKTQTFQDKEFNFKYDSDMFIFRYMHLDEVYLTGINYVKCGQIIGVSGIKKPGGGKYEDVHNPHLHFEITSSDKIINNDNHGNLKHRINQRVYMNYKITHHRRTYEYKIE